MNVHIQVTTASGSKYELDQKGDKLFIRKGISLSGEVVKLHEAIRIGGVLHVDFIKENIYCTPDSSTTFLRTTPIIDIQIR